MKASECIAHKIEETGEVQTVFEHLRGTAELAKSFAESFGSEDEAFRCGMLHDVGKYSEAFQRRINGAEIKVDHSTAGAAEAYKMHDIPAAFCIAGHHSGLPDTGSRADIDKTLLGRVTCKANTQIEDYSKFSEEVEIPPVKNQEDLIKTKENAFFYIHMLYSCLVDADWLDTERFMSGGKIERGTGESLETLSQKLGEFIEPWWKSENPLNVRRCKILRELIEAGEREKGIYTLTVPTGGGKTVSSMAFSLCHALKNKQRRIIYVIPYTSIIEQTQAVFERIFGAENVVAHYANVEYDTDEYGVMSRKDRLRYLASENWDAPIILTTAVQFFESLFGNSSSKCRKLHNIVNSVIVFDEAQMLPVPYIRPCVRAICELTENYGCTSVLCTATQPALGRIIEEFYPAGAKELCPDAEENYEFFRRVNYKNEGTLSDEELADRLSAEEQALCVVNSRKQAQKLYSLLPEEGSFHLSTLMTPCHRRKILDEIRNRLLAKKPCRVVSTSLIEAGVDVDFPAVYRSVAGLDSVIQAAGRCNRENKNSKEESTVHIFDTETKPPRALLQNIAAAKETMRRFSDIASPEAISFYFEFLLYSEKGKEELDSKGILPEIDRELAFNDISSKFKLIEDNGITVYIPIGEGKKLVDELVHFGPNRKLLRKLGQYAVTIRKNQYDKLSMKCSFERIDENTAVLMSTQFYDEHMGLSLSEDCGEALLDN